MNDDGCGCLLGIIIAVVLLCFFPWAYVVLGIVTIIGMLYKLVIIIINNIRK